MGNFELWRDRFLEGPRTRKLQPLVPETDLQGLRALRMMTPEPVADDWEDHRIQEAVPDERAEGVERLELVAPSSGREVPKSSERSPASRSRGKSTRSLGILPKPNSEPPSFGYGIPAVLKPLPPCAVAATGEEASDLPPEERFQTTYRQQFQSHGSVNYHTPEYFPTRFVPAGNRHAKEIKLNSLGAHVARAG